MRLLNRPLNPDDPGWKMNCKHCPRAVVGARFPEYNPVRLKDAARAGEGPGRLANDPHIWREIGIIMNIIISLVAEWFIGRVGNFATRGF